MDFFKKLISENKRPKVDIAIIGVPFDEGIILEGGRPGASKGPDAVRKQLGKYHKTYNLKHNVDLAPLTISDEGNVRIFPKNIKKTHAEISRLVEKCTKKADVTINIGGGHDLTAATISGFCQAHNKKVGCINIDAHFDVKRHGKIASGSPFFHALKENSRFFQGKNFVEIGMHDNFNSREDFDYLVEKKATVIPLGKVRSKNLDKIMNEAFVIAGKNVSAILFSLDIDSVAEAFAPGVSAPSSDGFNPSEIIRIAYLAGTNPKVKMFDLVEISPKYDIQDMTARLGATIIVAFLTGYMQRKIRGKSG